MNKASKQRKQLLEVFDRLTPEGCTLLIEFAEFVAQRHAAPMPSTEPVVVPRPQHESVVGAIKRLSASYPMLDKAKLFDETSGLMAQHVMHGRAAHDVIDELEILFRQHYERFAAQHEK